MAYEQRETSIEEGEPIECYLFQYDNIDYSYTSSKRARTLNVDGRTIDFMPEYIERGNTLKLGDSAGTVETCTVTVLRSNIVSMLFQGSPPELSTVRLRVFRVHGEYDTDYITLIDGVVSQVRMLDSITELTITIENILHKEIPTGKISYFCQNTIYDNKCRLDPSAWEQRCQLITGNTPMRLQLRSLQLALYPNNYFTDGYMRMKNCHRAIVKHEGDKIWIKYPINELDYDTEFYVYPGCRQGFDICAATFHNTDNFNGIPYQQSYDPFKHPVNRGAYWIPGSDIINRGGPLSPPPTP